MSQTVWIICCFANAAANSDQKLVDGVYGENGLHVQLNVAQDEKEGWDFVISHPQLMERSVRDQILMWGCVRGDTVYSSQDVSWFLKHQVLKCVVMRKKWMRFFDCSIYLNVMWGSWVYCKKKKWWQKDVCSLQIIFLCSCVYQIRGFLKSVANSRLLLWIFVFFM